MASPGGLQSGPDDQTVAGHATSGSPLHMVASVGGRNSFPSHAATLSASLLAPMVKWAPRSGRTGVYFDWEHALHRTCIGLGIIYGDLPIAPPTLESVGHSATRQTVKVTLPELEARFVAAFQAWQLANTALYWQVAPSLILVGEWSVAAEFNP